MCDLGRRLWQRDLVGAAEGNLSCRLSPQRILCTPQGVSKGHMKPDELVVIDNHGLPTDGKAPSTEIKLHTRIYKLRPDCQAIVHAHPPVATGFALAQESIPDDLLPEAGMVLGSVATVPFGFPGTEELPDAIEPLVEDHKTFLLCNHGALTIGKDLQDAYFRMETLERIAKMVLVAKLLGGERPMPDSAFKKVLASLNGNL